MKNKKLLMLALGIALTNQTLNAQAISSFSNEWYNTYSNGLTNNGIGIFTRGIIDNGNLVIAGSSWASWPSGTTDQLVTKVSSSGDVIFQTLRAPGDDHDGFGAVTVLDNGNYAFFGQQNAQGTQYFDGFYCVFNPNGVEQSYNFFSIPGSSSGSDMLKLPNGNLVFTGNHGVGNNYIALTTQNFVQIQYQTFNVSNNGWNSGYLAFDSVNNYIYAVSGETETNALQIKRYDLNLNLLNSFTINEVNPFKCYDVSVVNGNLWLCGYNIVSNNRYATVIKLDLSGSIADINTTNTPSEYTAITSYQNSIILSKSELSGTLPSSNNLISYLGNNNFGPSNTLNSGNPFVPFDLVIEQNKIYCIGVQGQNYYVGIPAIQKLTINSTTVPTYSDTCNNVSGSLTQGLVGYWPFCGNANDDSGHGNNGTVNGATLTTDRFGNSNSAYDFDGTSNINTNFAGVSNQGNRTISFWYNLALSNTTTEEWVMVGYGGNSAGSQFVPVIFPNNNPGIDVGASYVKYNLNTLQGWHFYTVSYNNLDGSNVTSVKLYIDGVLQTTLSGSFQTSTTIQTSSSYTFRIGNNNPTSTNLNQGFKGKIDDIGFWSRALTPTEITSLYNQNQCITNITVTDTLIINVGQLSYTNPVAYANNITIAPNPASTQININFNNIADLTGGSINIVNSLGQQVGTTPITASGTNTTMSLNTWGGSGLYFVQIQNSNGVVVDVKKIILQ